MNRISDERREVAERLKEYATGFDFGDSNPWWYVQKAVFGDVIAHDTSDAFALLADLIDPTCHVCIPNEIEGDCFCSECGALVGEYGYTSYCPNCGRRLVSGDDN